MEKPWLAEFSVDLLAATFQFHLLDKLHLFGQPLFVLFTLSLLITSCLIFFFLENLQILLGM